MKIVFYCQESAPANIDNYLSLGASGTVSALVLASHGLSKLGHEVVVLNRSECGDYQGTRYLTTCSADEAIEQVRRLGAVDVFVANGWAAEIFLEHDVPARRRVYWVHNFVDQTPFERAIREGRLDYIFCISLNQLGTWYRSPVFSRITRIYNCIDTDVIDRIPLAEGRERKIMFIGAPRESKGFHDALRVFDAFARRNPGYVLYVAGTADLHGSASALSDNGIFEKAYEEKYLGGLLKDSDGQPRKDVVLLGKLSREQVLLHLGTSRVALQNPSWTSQPEVHSVSALEAQAMGVPVVSTFRGGQPEVVENGKTGILARKRGDECLVAALERIVRDERLSGRMSADARQLVRSRFNVPGIARDWDRAMRAVAAGERFHGNLLRALRSKIRHKLHL